MAVLSSYRQVAFDQRDLSKGKDLQFNQEAQRGLCAGLCIAWVHNTVATHAPYVLDGLAANAKSIFVKQSIWVDADTTAQGSDIQRWNAVSHITRLKFTERATGNFVDPFATTMETIGVGYYALGLSGTKFGHMMAIFRGDSFVDIFDPNYGVFSAKLGEPMSDLAVQLWAEYKSVGLPIESWGLYALAAARSARDRMIAALAKQ